VIPFRLGSIPVRIHLSFFITAVLLSGAWDSPSRLLEWTAVVLVSVMLHELGHALMGVAFGLSPQIDLHGMGGTTSWTAARRALTPARSVAISVAGPGVGILVGGAVFAALAFGVVPPSPLAREIAQDMIWVNAGWGFVNLLPILPMDGGNVLFAILNAATKGRGERPSRLVSIVTALLLGLVSLVFFRMWWPAVLAAMFAWDNVRALRALAADTVKQPT
jgi:membrane-associated protease RseP (regulator of RpoE activity)